LVFGPILILRASYREAVDLTLINPDLDPTDAIIATRRGRTKYGYYINVEQAVTEQVGLFGRWSWNDGKNEIAALSDIDNSLRRSFDQGQRLEPS
jgi:high affinity Mn2+ porin